MRPLVAAGLLALAAGTPILAIGEASDNEVRRRAGDQMFDAGSTIAERAALRLELRMTELRDAFIAVAAGDLRSALATRDSEALLAASWTAANASAPGGLVLSIQATRVAVTDPTGDVLMELDESTLARPLRGLPVPDHLLGRHDPKADELLRAYEESLEEIESSQSRDRKPSWVSEPFIEPDDRRDIALITIGTMVYASDSSRVLKGMLLVDLPLAALAAEIARPSGAEDIYVFDRLGRYLFGARPPGTIALAEPKADRIVSKAVRAQSALAGFVDSEPIRENGADPFTGVQRPFASAVVRELGWHVLVVPDQSGVASADSTISQLRASRIVIVVLLVAATFAFASLMRRVLRQRADLATANVALAEARDSMAAATRHKSEFLANMSHELRTPLNAIIGFSDVLREGMFGELNQRQREYVDDIHSSGQHQLALINELLDLSKVEAGRMELAAGDLSLRATLEDSLTLLREGAARQGVELATEIEDGLDVIDADGRKLKQVLLNLLSNAVKFTPPGGWVTVRASRFGEEVQIAVRDTGVGIAAADLPRVFEEFRRVGEGSTKTEGTGLGLTLAKRFVELHGGRIWVESEVGKGSTFTFAIPVRQTALVDAKG